MVKTDIDQARRMLEIMEEHDLEEFEIERDGVRMRLRKRAFCSDTRRGGSSSELDLKKAPSVPDPSDGKLGEDGLILVKSPIVGTFYRAPAPDAEPFVEVGTAVKRGEVLCIIEAMKLMNKIDAEQDGEIVKIFVESGHPVQYGEELFAVRPT
jgi:acetyl-CoA carboxylase biotin carboxyl carrier protein